MYSLIINETDDEFLCLSLSLGMFPFLWHIMSTERCIDAIFFWVPFVANCYKLTILPCSWYKDYLHSRHEYKCCLIYCILMTKSRWLSFGLECWRFLYVVKLPEDGQAKLVMEVIFLYRVWRIRGAKGKSSSKVKTPNFSRLFLILRLFFCSEELWEELQATSPVRPYRGLCSPGGW